MMLLERPGRDRWAAHWNREEYRRPVAHPEIIEALRRYVGDVRGKRFLEVGAGMGGDSIALATEGAQAFAVDYLESALRSIEEFAHHGHVRLRVVQADAFALPFRDESFDAVFHQGLLEHSRTSDQNRILRENWRVLKPDGVLLVDVPQKYSLYTWYKRNLMRQGRWFAGWETEFSPRGLVRVVRNAGFTVHFTYPRGYYGILAHLRMGFASNSSQGRGRWAPLWMRKLYRGVWQWLGQTPMAAYLSWSVGVVAVKPRNRVAET